MLVAQDPDGHLLTFESDLARDAEAAGAARLDPLAFFEAVAASDEIIAEEMYALWSSVRPPSAPNPDFQTFLEGLTRRRARLTPIGADTIQPTFSQPTIIQPTIIQPDDGDPEPEAPIERGPLGGASGRVRQSSSPDSTARHASLTRGLAPPMPNDGRGKPDARS